MSEFQYFTKFLAQYLTILLSLYYTRLNQQEKHNDNFDRYEEFF
jgi:hypothetical protein